MIRHQIVDNEDLKEDFKEFTDKVVELKGLSNETKLEFYGLYKQATCGPCNVTRPGMFDFKGQAKFDAWKALGDLAKSDAMLMYIDLFNSLDEDDLRNSSENEGPVKVSTLYQPEEDIAVGTGDIWHACRHGNLAMIKQCYTDETLTGQDSEGRTLLHWTVDRNHLELTEWLIDQGCKLDMRDKEGNTPLHYAVTCDYIPIVKTLLKSGADTTICDEDGLTPLQLCESQELRDCFSNSKLKIS